jgi:galactose-1-phosphate uridylyltransferase
MPVYVTVSKVWQHVQVYTLEEQSKKPNKMLWRIDSAGTGKWQWDVDNEEENRKQIVVVENEIFRVDRPFYKNWCIKN